MPYGRYGRRTSGYRRTGYRKRFTARRYGGYRRSFKGKQSRVGAYRAHSTLGFKQRKIRRKLTNVAAIAEAGIATKRFRVRSSGTVLACNNGQVRYNSLPVFTRSTISNAIQQLWYLDPNLPDAPQIVNGNEVGSTNDTDWLFQAGLATCFFRNNSKVPVSIRVYLLEPKTKTSATPELQVANGALSNTQPTISGTTHALYFPSDSDTFNDIWKINKTWNKTLMNGGEWQVSISLPAVSIRSSVLAQDLDEYQPLFKSRTFLVRVEGQLGHEEDEPANIMKSSAAVDSYFTMSRSVKYDGGAAYDYVGTLDNMGAIIGPVVVGQKFTAANQELFTALDPPPFNPA